MGSKTFWRTTYDGVRVLHSWGNPMRILLETDFLFGTRRKVINMGQIEALHMAEKIFSAYGFGGTTPNWRKRFPDEFPNG
ncbi:MAG: hypothetical protein M5U23_02595 [Acidimicrobiia bacterium]|nr:hypothetical protein [Acidimicrobiia bacterium]